MRRPENVSERVGYIARGGLIEQFRREYVDDGRRFGTLGGLTVCRDDDLFHDRRGAQLEVEPGLLSGDDGDGLFLPVVTDGRGDGRNRSAFGQTREGIESGCVGRRSQRGSFDLDDRIGDSLIVSASTIRPESWFVPCSGPCARMCSEDRQEASRSMTCNVYFMFFFVCVSIV